MTMTALTDVEMDHLVALAKEFDQAGKTNEAAALVRAYLVLTERAGPVLSDRDEELGPQFIRDMEEAERNVAAGRLIPHEDVMRRLLALDDA